MITAGSRSGLPDSDDARAAIASAGIAMDPSDVLDELTIGSRSLALREYGPYTTIYNRFNRWAKRGRWCAIFEALAKLGKDSVALSLDSTSVKAHRCASGGKGGSTIRPSAARAVVARQKSMR